MKNKENLALYSSKLFALERISEIMRANDLNTKDVLNYVLLHKVCPQFELGNEFDLLCVVEGRKLRMPFNAGCCFDIIGIFPFPNEPEYLELDECENRIHHDSDVDYFRLLDVDFCRRIAVIRKRLNIYLNALGKPPVSGRYLADSQYMKNCGWIVGFKEETSDISSHYYGGSTPAKLRYMGKFTR